MERHPETKVVALAWIFKTEENDYSRGHGWRKVEPGLLSTREISHHLVHAMEKAAGKSRAPSVKLDHVIDVDGCYCHRREHIKRRKLVSNERIVNLWFKRDGNADALCVHYYDSVEKRFRTDQERDCNYVIKNTGD